MVVDYENSIVLKPSGKRTPAKKLKFTELMQFIEVFKKGVDVTSPSEAVASWIADGYDEQQVIRVLHSVVVEFGGGHRIWGRYHETWEASPREMNAILSDVHRRRGDNADDLRSALRAIKGLGGLSYSTKMLRFLSPHHVVLDLILREELGLNEADYSEFANNCRRISEVLGVVPVDVESGLFAFVQAANPNQRNKFWKSYHYLTIGSTV